VVLLFDKCVIKTRAATVHSLKSPRAWRVSVTLSTKSSSVHVQKRSRMCTRRQIVTLHITKH